MNDTEGLVTVETPVAVSPGVRVAFPTTVSDFGTVLAVNVFAEPTIP